MCYQSYSNPWFTNSVPDGVYLSHPGSEITIYDTGLVNSDAIFSEDLETIPITLIPTDVEYNHGRMVAVSKGYISYAAKGMCYSPGNDVCLLSVFAC